MNEIIKAIEDAQLKSDVADFNVGDTVKVGDLIGKAADGISANIHATVNGVVTAVSEQGVEIKCS